MEALLHEIIELLIGLGPWIVFLVTASETAVFLGLLIPAEATVLVAAFMADIGYFDVEDVLLATLLGGLVGDHIGYILGRTAGRRAAARGGRLGRLWRRHEARATLLFRQRSLIAVSAARFLSFVRTLMPWFAGMSGMPYPRFLAYDLLGVAGWGTGSVAAGYMAGRSWQVLASALGTASAIIIIAAVLIMAGYALRLRRRARRLRRVAVTGNVASGKTAVTERWRTLGAEVIDADDLARRAVEPGSEALRQIVARFGRGVLDEEGRLDRAAVRDIVFEDEERRRLLESILHPEIERLRHREERRLAAAGSRLVVHAIPLLFETGLQDRFDSVVLVDAPEDVRRERMVRERALSPAQADAMIRAQLPAAGKRARADHIIDNDRGLQELEEEADRVWEQIRSRHG